MVPLLVNGECSTSAKVLNILVGTRVSISGSNCSCKSGREVSSACAYDSGKYSIGVSEPQ